MLASSYPLVKLRPRYLFVAPIEWTLFPSIELEDDFHDYQYSEEAKAMCNGEPLGERCSHLFAVLEASKENDPL